MSFEEIHGFDNRDVRYQLGELEGAVPSLVEINDSASQVSSDTDNESSSHGASDVGGGGKEVEDDSTHYASSDGSSELGSDSSGEDNASKEARSGLKRSRDEAHSTDTDSASDHEMNAESSLSFVSPHNLLISKRHGRHERKKERFMRLRSPSPFYEWEVGEKSSQASPQSSDRGTEDSEEPGSLSEMEYASFFASLIDESEMLPSSNFDEAHFLAYQAQVLKGNCWFPYDLDTSANQDEADTSMEVCEDDKIVCYGIMYKRGVRVLAQGLEALRRTQTAQPGSETLKERKILVFKLFQEDQATFLLQSLVATDGEPGPFDNIAVLNKGDATILSEVSRSCNFEVYSTCSQWTPIADETKAVEKATVALVDILIYGPRRCAQDVGEYLNDRKVFLQEPDYWDFNHDYSNPHILDLNFVTLESQTGLEESRSSFFQLDIDLADNFSEQTVTSLSLLNEKIATAFKNMTRARNLKRIAADIRIQTTLKPYQEEALDFIMQRESGPVPIEYRLWKSNYIDDELVYEHAITGCQTNDIPVETRGGILADEMGLGKTLTMLSATIRTAQEAKDFASNTYHAMHLRAGHTLISSRATLVVVPSPLLLNEWMHEIKIHCVGFTNINLYHGHGREGNAKALADSDIVLSTYHTISHESSDKESPLWKIRWFRIILDEAHIIRRMSTRLFKATKKLRSKYYWCLTGTPVQNSLEDLAALISFIRAAPLDDLHKFRKHVVAPLIKGSENGVENLRRLLDSVCLRRTKHLLNLPQAVYELRTLKFSAAEEQHYNDTRDRLVKLINKNSLKSKNQKGFLGVFQLQLQLRRLCNHGSFQKASLGAEEFDPDQAIAMLKKQKDNKCQTCDVKITGIQGIEEKRSGTFTVCGHLLCRKCVPKSKSALKPIDGRDGCLQCSLCPEAIFGNYLLEEAGSKSSGGGSNKLSPWQYFDKAGRSTKVSEVVADIVEHKTEGKSIVFSCWTRSLDLIGIFLTSRNIPFVRIDGSHSLGQRKQILERYQKQPAVKILLMTTGTGAVGLNLTVANTVYILEPQWNPMVENQAIARVLRLGQERNVKVVRYVMKGTVEEVEMQKQQVRKLEYAKVGWKGDEAS